jgi:formiminotetrahydrofolate cyclodeaminase
MALGNMTASLTVGKEKYADVEDEVVALKRKADALQDRLIKLVARDAEVFAPLVRAYRLPTDTEARRRHKAEIMEACLRRCCAVPLEIMKCCCEAIDLCERFSAIGAAIAISDVGCGATCLRAALEAASLNVFINTASMADRTQAETTNAQANQMLKTHVARANAIFGDVASRFK